MSLGIELKKLKRTGYFPAFLAGGLVAAAFPAIYMGVKAETLAPFSGNPVQLLMTATWQMSAMLNMLISICGACMMYHTEYADNGMQKMLVLPVRQSAVFFGKFVIAAAALALMTIMEIAALAGCAQYWFTKNALDVPELLKTAGFQIIAALPTVMRLQKYVGISWHRCDSCIYFFNFSAGQCTAQSVSFFFTVSDIL